MSAKEFYKSKYPEFSQSEHYIEFAEDYHTYCLQFKSEPVDENGLDEMAEKSYKDNEPNSKFGIFSIKEVNYRELYKEGYIDGYKAHLQRSSDGWSDEELHKMCGDYAMTLQNSVSNGSYEHDYQRCKSVLNWLKKYPKHD